VTFKIIHLLLKLCGSWQTKITLYIATFRRNEFLFLQKTVQCLLSHVYTLASDKLWKCWPVILGTHQRNFVAYYCILVASLSTLYYWHMAYVWHFSNHTGDTYPSCCLFVCNKLLFSNTWVHASVDNGRRKAKLQWVIIAGCSPFITLIIIIIIMFVYLIDDITCNLQ